MHCGTTGNTRPPPNDLPFKTDRIDGTGARVCYLLRQASTDTQQYGRVWLIPNTLAILLRHLGLNLLDFPVTRLQAQGHFPLRFVSHGRQ